MNNSNHLAPSTICQNRMYKVTDNYSTETVCFERLKNMFGSLITKNENYNFGSWYFKLLQSGIELNWTGKVFNKYYRTAKNECIVELVEEVTAKDTNNYGIKESDREDIFEIMKSVNDLEYILENSLF